jgi:hypothetical protein
MYKKMPLIKLNTYTNPWQKTQPKADLSQPVGWEYMKMKLSARMPGRVSTPLWIAIRL